jgi:hypothetical protein
VNHVPSCTCRPGFTGEPFRFCNILPPPRKILKLICSSLCNKCMQCTY